MKTSKNFPRNHAVLGLFLKNCSGDEVDTVHGVIGKAANIPMKKMKNFQDFENFLAFIFNIFPILV